MLLPSEFSHNFITYMKNRMKIGYFRYNCDNNKKLDCTWCIYNSKKCKNTTKNTDYMAYLKNCLKKYEAEHNTEYLVDIANLAMLEFQYPGYLDAHFTPQDRKD